MTTCFLECRNKLFFICFETRSDFAKMNQTFCLSNQKTGRQVETSSLFAGVCLLFERKQSAQPKLLYDSVAKWATVLTLLELPVWLCRDFKCRPVFSLSHVFVFCRAVTSVSSPPSPYFSSHQWNMRVCHPPVWTEPPVWKTQRASAASVLTAGRGTHVKMVIFLIRTLTHKQRWVSITFQGNSWIYIHLQETNLQQK